MQCFIFLSTEQEQLRAQKKKKKRKAIGKVPILFDIYFANKSETHSNIWF